MHYLHKACVVGFNSIVAKILHCLHRELCSVVMFHNLQVVRLLHVYTGIFVQWIIILKSSCGEALVSSVRSLCRGDALALSAQGIAW